MFHIISIGALFGIDGFSIEPCSHLRQEYIEGCSVENKMVEVGQQIKGGVSLYHFQAIERTFVQMERHDEALLIVFIFSIAHLLSSHNAFMFFIPYLHGLIVLKLKMTSKQGM